MKEKIKKMAMSEMRFIQPANFEKFKLTVDGFAEEMSRDQKLIEKLGGELWDRIEEMKRRFQNHAPAILPRFDNEPIEDYLDRIYERSGYAKAKGV